jgi:hypothetical protein
MTPFIRALAIGFIALLVGSGVGGSHTPKAHAVEVSPVAERAFEDVTTCLTSGREKSLDVFYLIDQSGSLSRTDPDQVRVDIIRNSVTELGSFVEQGINVRVAAAGFADGVRRLQDWVAVESETSAATLGESLSQQILDAPVSYQNWTDWEAGLRFAKDSFDSDSGSCAMLIWFTDGAINPSNGDALSGLSALCRPEISALDIVSGPGQYGLLQQFRSAGIPVFGVYLSTEEEDNNRDYQSAWLTGFMKPIVEGQGEVLAVEDLPGGTLTCGEVDADGFAPPGQANGAFIDAADPVLLAFQFLRIGGQISGGNGIAITDGRFVVPLGTAGFQVIVSSTDWSLTGPTDSQFTASSASPGQVVIAPSGGATKISVAVGNDVNLVGEWQLATPAQYSELFLYSGLTIELDRDKVSTILSDFDNTLTGRVVRTQEFLTLPVDLALYPDSNFSMSLLENGMLALQDIDLEYTPDGQFKIERFNPGDQTGELELWLTLSLGDAFQPITSRFNLSIVDKTSLATPASDVIELSLLEGPSGVATGTLTITGPNVSETSTFCLSSNPSRLDDTLAKGDQPVDRVEGFSWTFSGLTPTVAGNCVEVAQGETTTIAVEARNPTQANSSIVSSWQVTSTTPGTAAAFDAPLTIQFDSVTQSNRAVEIGVIIALLVAGLLLPLAVMWLINWGMTRFLPIDSVMRASFPVVIDGSGPFSKLLLARSPLETSPLTVGPDDFKNQMDHKALRDFDTGAGTAQARIPLFPLATTWYEWQAPAGHRVIGFFDGGSKNSKAFDSGKAIEVSPNMSDNWALVIPDSEMRKPDGEKIAGQLIVFSRMANLSEYQKRVGEISLKPGLGDRLVAVKSALEAESVASGPGDNGAGETPADSFTASPLPNGFTPSSSPGVPPGSPLQPPRAPQSGPLAPPPPPQ